MSTKSPPEGHVHYFAFGSNMSTERLQARIPSAQAIGRGRLWNWTMICNKSGLDGSAKANIARAENHWVWGVIFVVPEDQLHVLDGYEGGYERHPVQVKDDDDNTYHCATYSSDRTTGDRRLNSVYRQYMVDGAREHGLPTRYVAELASKPTKSNQ